ncbi:MAG: HNH endonuclease [Acidimicrobiia bacterium]|nr:HNH endonuclease [Acidimicrobiia bacterium]
MTLVDNHLLGISAPVDGLDATFGQLVGGLRACPSDVALRRCQGFVQRLDALETELLADRRRAGASVREVEEAAGRGSMRSAAEARKRSKRAEVLTHNPDLVGELDGGRLTGEHLDALAVASEQSEGDAARDAELVDRLADVNPDQAKGVARQWVDERQAGDLESEHERQRRLRDVSRPFTTDRGTKALFVEGDRVSIDQIDQAIDCLADQLYRRDGGRDLPTGQHPRTRDQRRFDALHALVTGQRTDTDTDAAPAGPSRPTMVVAAGPAAFGPDTSGTAELIGSGPLPRSVFERLVCNSDLVGAVFGADGQPLWLGRKIRMVSPGQWLALVARDKGCVLCGAHVNRCEAHHLIPWQAPAEGRTDITNLALVCGDCHHHIHDTYQTLVCHHEGATGHPSWKLRPATPDERPPPRANPPP